MHAIKAGEGDVFISAGVETVSRFLGGSSIGDLVEISEAFARPGHPQLPRLGHRPPQTQRARIGRLS